jgi:Uma2 family endonuclease
MKAASRVIRKVAMPESLATTGTPRLCHGDHLTVEEFLRRYDAMPDLKKAELIEGVVYMPSPVRIESHGGQQFDLITWLGVYRANTPGVQGGDNSTIRLPLGMNVPQPDACLRVRPGYGGQSQTSDDGYVAGAPEWVGEVSASTKSYDLHEKLSAYQRNGVQEYVVWCVEDESIDWFVLRDDVFREMPHRGGVFKSKVFPGLWLDAMAMLNGDMAKVLKILDKGLGSDEHRRFVARLAKQKARSERGT